MPTDSDDATHHESLVKAELRCVQSVDKLVGNTPLVCLGDETESVPVYIKMESMNPSGSMRDRYVAEIVRRALMAGQIRPGDTVVLAGIDDSAVSAAFLGSVMGLKVKIFAPQSSSRRLVGMIQRYGASIEWLEGPLSLTETVSRAARWAREVSDRFFVDGYRRGAVEDAYREIADEILTSLEGKLLGGFVTSVTTGATFREVSRILKARQPDLKVRGARLVENAFATADEDPEITVSTLEDAWVIRDEIAAEFGVLLGPKGAACAAVARNLVQHVKPGRAIVALNPDSGQRYLGWEEQPLFTI